MAVINRPDGYGSFLGGCNEGLHPHLIREDQTRRNINCSLATGGLTPRMPYRELRFNFISPGLARERPSRGSLTYEDNLYAGRLQHVGKYQTSIGDFMVLVVNGVIYLLNVKTLTIQVAKLRALNDSVLNFYQFRINGTQAGEFYILFDWPNQPVYISNDLVARRTKRSNIEIPRAYIGTFVQNRTIIGNKGTEWGASDPLRPDNPKAAIEFRESIVDSDENPNPAFGNQFFSLSHINRQSEITAMGYLKQTEGTSALGYGPLFISTKESISLFAVNQPRDQWEAGQFGSAYIFNYGIVGQRAFANAGADLIYRSVDGMIYSTAKLYSEQRQWGHTNISEELRKSFEAVNEDLLSLSYVTYHKNKIYAGLKPHLVRCLSLYGAPYADVVFDGVGVLEFNAVSGVGSQGVSPAWAGVNDGSFMDAIEIDKRLYYVGKRGPLCEENFVLIQEQVRGRDFYVNSSYPIRSRVYTKEFSWKEHLLMEKNLQYLHLGFGRIKGSVTVRAYVRDSETCRWTFFNQIQISDKAPADIPIHNQYLYRSEDAEASGLRLQLRLDLEGEDYELISLFLIAEANDTKSVPIEFEIKPCEDFGNNGDLELWQHSPMQSI